jgi:hypothetical protein
LMIHLSLSVLSLGLAPAGVAFDGR